MVEADRISAPMRAGELLRDEPMRKHTSWRAGGSADHAYRPSGLADLCRFLRRLPAREQVYFVGLGSNLLVRDGGVRGTVVFTHALLKQVELSQQANGRALVYAEAGVASPKVSRFAATHDLLGAEFLAGIPGTIGGALAMNAGCYGSQTWDVVDKVLTVSRQGRLRRRMPSDYEIGYRHVALRERTIGGAQEQQPEEFFAACWLRFTPGDGAKARELITQYLRKRIATQPLEQPNAGSVFRNPPNDFAARLIESCGLKGHAIGGAMVSPKHANFIVNTGEASAADIERLIEHVQRTVLEQTGVALEREVRIIGEPVLEAKP